MLKDVLGNWVTVHLPTHSEVIARNAHEPHEGCAGNLVIVKVDGNPDVRKAIAVLLAPSPSMLALLEKAWPIIEAEADKREEAFFGQSEPYWSEMRELANEIQAEIDRAYGREPLPNDDPDDEDFDDLAETEKEIKAKWREKEDSHG